MQHVCNGTRHKATKLCTNFNHDDEKDDDSNHGSSKL